MELTVVKNDEISKRTGKFDAKHYSVKTGINICLYLEFSVLESLEVSTIIHSTPVKLPHLECSQLFKPFQTRTRNCNCH